MAECSVEGCGKKVAARGWCSTHYARWQAHGDPLVTLRPRHATCSIQGCNRKHAARGYCGAHYTRIKRNGGPEPKERAERKCSIQGCDRRHSALGYCEMHRRRMQLYGDPHRGRDDLRTQFECNVDGCSGQAVARHLCTKHYSRWRTHGDPLVNKRAAGQERRARLDWRRLDDVAQLPWRTNPSGYASASWPEHPNASKQGHVAHHQAVMAAVLGRPIRAGETVHHKNGIRDDNRPQQLELWLSAHPPGQRVSELIAFAHELLERYRDDPALWPEHLRP